MSSAHIVFTSINHKYLARALLLGKSIKEYNNKVHFVVVLVEKDLTFTQKQKSELLSTPELNCVDEIITLEDLPIGLRKSISNLDVIEQCTAVKADAMLSLLNRPNSETVTYIDPDIYVYGDIKEIEARHAELGDVLLTPHLISEPISETHVVNNEIAGSMNHGIFNLGFISAKKSQASIQVIQWWAERLRLYCLADYKRGIFTDQKWFDVGLIYFPCIGIVRDPSWNMAPWNTFERTLIALNPPKLSSGENLLFFHFSKAPSKIFFQVLRSNGSNFLLENLADMYVRQLDSQENMLIKVRDQFFKQVYDVPKSKKRSGSTPAFWKKQAYKVATHIGKRSPELVVMSTKHRQVQRLIAWLREEAEVMGKGLAAGNYLKAIPRSVHTLVISHRGGGGVEEFVDSRASRGELGSEWVVVKPVNKNQYTYYSNILTPSIGRARLDQILEIMEVSEVIELHHLMGNESLRPKIIHHPQVNIFLHDRYLVTQTPFVDASQFLSAEHNQAEINQPLDQSIALLDSKQWQSRNIAILKSAVNIFAPSHFIKEEFDSNYEGLDVQVVEWSDKSALNPLEIENGAVQKIVVISPTGLHKGVSTLKEVATILNQETPTVEIIVIGQLSTYWESLLKEVPNIRLFGQIPRNRIQRYLLNNPKSLGWVPSLTGEAYSLALDDFLITRTSVLVSQVGALKERSDNQISVHPYSPTISAYELANKISILLAEKVS